MTKDNLSLKGAKPSSPEAEAPVCLLLPAALRSGIERHPLFRAFFGNTLAGADEVSGLCSSGLTRITIKDI